MCVDAAFATNPDKTSQIGTLAMIRKKERKGANVIHMRHRKAKELFEVH